MGQDLMSLCPGMCTDAMCPMRGGQGPESLAILNPEEALLRGRCFLNMAGSGWLWTRHQPPPHKHTLIWAMGLSAYLFLAFMPLSSVVLRVGAASPTWRGGGSRA